MTQSDASGGPERPVAGRRPSDAAGAVDGTSELVVDLAALDGGVRAVPLENEHSGTRRVAVRRAGDVRRGRPGADEVSLDCGPINCGPSAGSGPGWAPGAGAPPDARCRVEWAGGHGADTTLPADLVADDPAVFLEVCRACDLRERPVVVAGDGVVWGYLWVGEELTVRTTADPVTGRGAPGVHDDLAVPPDRPPVAQFEPGTVGAVRAVGATDRVDQFEAALEARYDRPAGRPALEYRN